MTAPYTAGTINLVAGSTAVVGTDTAWQIGLIIGGTIYVEFDGGNPLPIETVDGDTEITASLKWTGPTGTYSYAIVRDTAYGQQTVANAQALATYIQRLNNPALAATAGVTPGSNKLLLFTGANSATVIDLEDILQGVKFDEEVPTLADRAAYDGEAEGFRVLVADVGDGRSAFFSKKSATAGDWTVPFYITGPVGGAGPYTDITIGDTTTLPAGSEAEVTLVPVSPGVIRLDFGLPKGADGEGTGNVNGPDGGVLVNQIAGFADTTGNLIKGLTPEEVRIYAQVAKGGYAGRDFLINGNRRRWLRGNVQTTIGYLSRDRWGNNFASSTVDTGRGIFALGQTEVPGYPESYERTQWVPGSDNVNAFGVVFQDIWDVRKLAGRLVTLTFWARASYARPFPIELQQSYGTGGSPSPSNSFLAGTYNVGTAWQRFSSAFIVPPIAGKTLGTNGNSRTEFIIWLDGGTAYQSRNGNLPRMPQGYIDIAQMSMVEGDATGEVLPVPYYDPDIEDARMNAYQQIMMVNLRAHSRDGGSAWVGPLNWPAMRRSPDLVLRGNGQVFGAQAFDIYNVNPTGARPELIANGGGDVGVIDRSYFLYAEG